MGNVSGKLFLVCPPSAVLAVLPRVPWCLVTALGPLDRAEQPLRATDECSDAPAGFLELRPAAGLPTPKDSAKKGRFSQRAGHLVIAQGVLPPRTPPHPSVESPTREVRSPHSSPGCFHMASQLPKPS